MLHTPSKENFDFWDFYLQNKREVDGIIWSVCWAHQEYFNPNEMYSEIIIRLHRSKFVEQFDPNKGSIFSTYLSMKVENYARHVIERDFRRRKIDCMTEYQRILFNDINAMNGTENEDTARELLSQDDVEEDFMFNEMCECVTSKLKEKAQIAFSMIFEGYAKCDIAEVLGCTSAYMTQLSQKIKKRILNVKGIKNVK